MFFIALLFVVAALASTDPPSPNCTPYPGVDFTYMMTLEKCLQLTCQNSSQVSDFYFNWCQKVPGMGCGNASFVTQGTYSNSQCYAGYNEWLVGMTYNNATQTATYSVVTYTPWRLKATVHVACDPSGMKNVITCPNTYKWGDTPYDLEVTVTSRNACLA